MKTTTPLVLGIASNMPNSDMVENFLSKYFTIEISADGRSRRIVMDQTPINIITL
jgi:hypothetical protein